MSRLRELVDALTITSGHGAACAESAAWEIDALVSATEDALERYRGQVETQQAENTRHEEWRRIADPIIGELLDVLRAGLHAFRANVDGAASYCWTDDADRVLALAAKLGRLEWEAPESDNGANCKLGTGPATEPR